jgi:transposase
LEKIRIVQLTMQPGSSVSEVARAHDVNANQLFKWRRLFERGELTESSGALIPVRVSNVAERLESSPPSKGSIHIEFPGRALINVERGADSSLLRSILESLRR